MDSMHLVCQQARRLQEENATLRAELSKRHCVLDPASQARLDSLAKKYGPTLDTMSPHEALIELQNKEISELGNAVLFEQYRQKDTLRTVQEKEAVLVERNRLVTRLEADLEGYPKLKEQAKWMESALFASERKSRDAEDRANKRWTELGASYETRIKRARDTCMELINRVHLETTAKINAQLNRPELLPHKQALLDAIVDGLDEVRVVVGMNL